MSKLNLSYPAILDLFREHLDPKRTESASFLIWYLENYYRLDTVEAVDAVCDQKGDKGVDGIYVNEAEACIYIFQSRISQKVNSSVGDTSLKEFQGTLSQFKDEAAIQNLIKTGGKVFECRSRNAACQPFCGQMHLVSELLLFQLYLLQGSTEEYRGLRI